MEMEIKMRQIDISAVNEFVNSNIERFHNSKLKSLEKNDLKNILKKKNPYLFKAKNITLASNFIAEILDAFLSSSEEKSFGDFLEELAIFISGLAYDGRKSSASGIDLEFNDRTIHYVVSVKSGTNWGNNSQHKKQEQDFKKAVQVLKQSNHTINVQPVLGICYGKTKTSYLNGYMKVVGQNFWYLISGEKSLYTDIIEPIGYEAKRHNDAFIKKKSEIINKFTGEFVTEFCENGVINWDKLVQFNSGNLDLDVFLKGN